MSTSRDDLKNYIRQKAREKGVDENLALSIAHNESRFNPNATSKDKQGNPIAHGVMQLIPSTASRYGLKPEDFKNGYKNIDAGVSYLSDLNKRYKGNARQIAGAYHAGEGAVDPVTGPIRKKGYGPKTENYVDNVDFQQAAFELDKPSTSTKTESNTRPRFTQKQVDETITHPEDKEDWSEFNSLADELEKPKSARIGASPLGQPKTMSATPSPTKPAPAATPVTKGSWSKFRIDDTKNPVTQNKTIAEKIASGEKVASVTEQRASTRNNQREAQGLTSNRDLIGALNLKKQQDLEQAAINPSQRSPQGMQDYNKAVQSSRKGQRGSGVRPSFDTAAVSPEQAVNNLQTPRSEQQTFSNQLAEDPNIVTDIQDVVNSPIPGLAYKAIGLGGEDTAEAARQGLSGLTDNAIGAREEPSTALGAFSKTVGGALPFAAASFVPGGQEIALEMGLGRFGQAALPQAIKFGATQATKEAALGNFQNNPYESLKKVGGAAASAALGAAGEVIAPGLAPTLAGNVAKGAGRLALSTGGALIPGVTSRISQGQDIGSAIEEELPAALVSAAPTVAGTFSGPRVEQPALPGRTQRALGPGEPTKPYDVTGELINDSQNLGEFAPPGYVRDPGDGSLIPANQVDNIQASENQALPFRSAASNQTQEFPVNPTQDFRTREMRAAPSVGNQSLTTRNLAGQEQLPPFGGSTLQQLPDVPYEQGMAAQAERYQTSPIKQVPDVLPQNEYSTNKLDIREQANQEQGMVNQRRAALRNYFDEKGGTGYIDDQGKPMLMTPFDAERTRTETKPLGETPDVDVSSFQKIEPSASTARFADDGVFGRSGGQTPTERISLPRRQASTPEVTDKQQYFDRPDLPGQGSGMRLPEFAQTGRVNRGKTKDINQELPPEDMLPVEEIARRIGIQPRRKLQQNESVSMVFDNVDMQPISDMPPAFSPTPKPNVPEQQQQKLGFREPNIVSSKKKKPGFDTDTPAQGLPVPVEPAPIEPLGTFNPIKGETINESKPIEPIKPSGKLQEPVKPSEPINNPPIVPTEKEAIRVQSKSSGVVAQGSERAGKVKIAAQGYTSDLVSPHSKTKIKSRFSLVDAREPQTSHDDYFNTNPLYPQELQPRVEAKRRMEVIHGEQGMIENFAPEMLGESGVASQGAPTMNGKGEIESGNGRAILVRKLYSNYKQKGAQYKEWLVKNAKKFGLDPKQIEGMEQPMLVRARETELTPEQQLEFTRVSNEKDVQDYSPVERAMVDAEKLDLTKLKKIGETGDLTARENGSFMQDFINKIARPADRARLMKNGKPTQEGVRRAQNALFSKAFGTDKETLRILGDVTESTDADYRNITNVLIAKSPRIALIKEGATENAPYDISKDISVALNQYANLRESGKPVNEFLKQENFAEPLTDNQVQLLKLFDKAKRTPSILKETIDTYLDTAQKEVVEHAAQDSMFGNLGPEKGELLEGAINQVEKARADKANAAAEKKAQKAEAKEQGGLFGTEFSKNQRAKADAADVEAQAALKEFNKKGSGSVGSFNIDPSQAALLGKFATKRVEAIARRAAAGGVDFLANPKAYYNEFSEEMKRLFGEGVTPHLEKLYNYAIEPIKPMRPMENKDVGPNQGNLFEKGAPITKEMSLAEQNKALGTFNPSERLEINKPIKPMENRNVEPFQKDLFDDKGYKTQEMKLSEQQKELGRYNPSERLENNKPIKPMEGKKDVAPVQRDLFNDQGYKTQEMKLSEQNKELGSYNPSKRLEINKPLDVDFTDSDYANLANPKKQKKLAFDADQVDYTDTSKLGPKDTPITPMDAKSKEYKNLSDPRKQMKLKFEEGDTDYTDTSRLDDWKNEPIKPMEAEPRKENSWLKSLSSGIKANLLSRVSSALNDVISTGANIGARQGIEEPIRAIADKVLSYLPRVIETPSFNEKGEIVSTFEKAKGGERTFTQQGFKDIAENLTAAYEGVGKGKDIALKRNLSAEELKNMETHEINTKRTGNKTVDKAIGLFDSAVNAVGRVRNALDEPAYQYALKNATNSRARVEAVNSGKSVESIKKILNTFESSPQDLSVSDYKLADRMINGVKDSKGNITQEGAKHEALYITFKNDTKFSETWSRLKAAGWEGGTAKQLLAFAADQLIPFARTQANILKQGYDISVDPLVKGAKTITKAVKQKGLTVEDQGTLAKATGRAALGLAVGAAGYGLGKTGAALSNIEFNPFSGGEKQEKELNKAANRDAGSIEISGRRISGNVLGSYRPIFNAGTNIAKANEDPDATTGDKIKKVAGGLLDSALTHPVTTGLRDLVYSGFGPEGALRREGARRIASAIVPSILSDLATPINKAVTGEGAKERRTANAGKDGFSGFFKGTKEAIQEKVPIWREKLPQAYTALGETNEKPFFHAIDPFRSKEERKSKVISEYDRAGIGFAPLQKNKDESEQDFSARSRLTGNMTKKQLEALVESSVYNEASSKFARFGERFPAFKQSERKTKAELLKDTEQESHKLNVSVPGLSLRRVVNEKLGEKERELETKKKRRIAEAWTGR